jgi:type IV secretory pathway VirB3-like protein
MARAAMMSGLNIPVWHILWVLGIPVLFVIVSRNFLWVALIPALAYVSREITGEDEFRARCVALAIISGVFFSRRRGGAHVVPALPPNKRIQGMLDG